MNYVMKKFKAESIDIKQMSNIRGGDVEVTLDDLKVNVTKKKNNVAVKNDTKIEIAGTVTIETE